MASAPLVTADGHLLGSLSVTAGTPRDLTAEHADRLRDLAGLAVAALERRRRRQVTLLAEVEHQRALLTAARARATALEAAGERLRRSNDELTHLAAVAGHDLAAPLTAVIGYLDLVLDVHRDDLGAQGSEWLGTALRAAHRMQGLIEAVLVHSLADGERCHPRRVDVRDVLRHVVEDLGTSCAAARIGYTEVPAHPAAPSRPTRTPSCCASSCRTSSPTPSATATPTGRAASRSPSPPCPPGAGNSRSPTTAAASPPTSATASSRCSPPGPPPWARHRPGHLPPHRHPPRRHHRRRADPRRRRHPARHLLPRRRPRRLPDGSAAPSPEPGSGPTGWVTTARLKTAPRLPMGRRHPQHPSAEAPTHNPTRPFQVQEDPVARVLVVEDDPDIRQLVELRLRGLGHRVVSAPSGAEALAVIAERGAPEVVVLDVAMPGMTGLEVLRTLRAQPETADLPAIFLSARVRPEDIAAGEELGAVYLTKPFVVSALAGAIDKALQANAQAAGGW